jgi:phytoene dehydrogenase-like protein
VEKINVVDGVAESVVLESGEIKTADYVIVTGDPSVAFGKLLNEELMPNKLKELYDNPRMMRFSSYHCAFACDLPVLPFQVDMVVEVPEKYRISLRSEYLIMREFSNETDFSPRGKNLVQTMIYCTEDSAKDFIELSKNLSLYREKKKQLAETIKEIIVDAYPQLKKKIKCIDVWTPATYKRYTGSQIGSFMSFVLPSKTIPRRLSNKIDGIKNVILATQWLQMPGGLPIAARVGKSAIDTLAK